MTALALPCSIAPSPFRPARMARFTAFAIAIAAAGSLAPAPVQAQVLVQSITPPPGSNHVGFGAALSVQGSTLIVGDGEHRQTIGSCPGGYGAVQTYKKVSGAWQHSQSFLHTLGSPENKFGRVVELRGNIFIATAERENYVNGATTIGEAGAFFVYRRPSSFGTFSLLQKVYSPTPLQGERFTFMVGAAATNGTYFAAAGNPQISRNVYVYQLQGNNVVHVSTILPPDPAVGQRLFITDQNVLVIISNGTNPTPYAYALSGSQATPIDTSSLAKAGWGVTQHGAGDGNTVAYLKWEISTSNYALAVAKFTSSGVQWSDFRTLPMSYDNWSDGSGPSGEPSGMAIDENQGIFIGYPSASSPFVLGYKYANNRYNHAGVVRPGHHFAVTQSPPGYFASAVAYSGNDLFIGDRSLEIIHAGTNACTSPGATGTVHVLQPQSSVASGPDGSTKLQPWLSSTTFEMGATVATDGTFALAGSAWDPDARDAYGLVTLFQNVSGQWQPIERYVDGWAGWSGFTGWSAFGVTADINENAMVIGAPQAASNLTGERSGAVYIARKVNGVFENGAVLTNESALGGVVAGSYFGRSVSLTGNTLAIGAPDWENPPNRGTVWVYEWSGSGSDWVSSNALGPGSPTSQDWETFGYAVDTFGDYLISGIPYRSTGGKTYNGAIEIFRRDASGFYNSVLQADAPSALPDFAYLGATVSIGADWAAAAGGSGSVVTYRRNSNGTWSQSTVITPNPAMNGFGWSVAVEGTRLVVGSPFENKVHRYERSGGVWNLTGSITGQTTSGTFGSAVAFKNGNVIIGDPGATVGTGGGTAIQDTGAAYFIGFFGI